MKSNYKEPNTELPSDSGGSFIGTGSSTKCIMPSPMTPSTPLGGLFGPDSYAPFWGNPGYDTPENMSNPGIFIPYMPAPLPPDAFAFLGDDGLSGAPGTRPSIGWSSLSSVGTTIVANESDVIAQRYGGYFKSYFGPERVRFPKKEKKEEPDVSEEQSKERKPGLLERIWNGVKTVLNAVVAVVSVVLKVAAGVLNTVRRGIERGIQTAVYKYYTHKTWSESWRESELSEQEDYNQEGTPFIRGCRWAELGLNILLMLLTGLKAAGVTGPEISLGLGNELGGIGRFFGGRFFLNVHAVQKLEETNILESELEIVMGGKKTLIFEYPENSEKLIYFRYKVRGGQGIAVITRGNEIESLWWQKRPQRWWGRRIR